MISPVACVLLTFALVTGSPVPTGSRVTLNDIKEAAADIQPPASRSARLLASNGLSEFQVRDRSDETNSACLHQDLLLPFPCNFTSHPGNTTSMLLTANTDLTIIKSYLQWVQESRKQCLGTADNQSLIGAINTTMDRVEVAKYRTQVYLHDAGIRVPADQNIVNRTDCSIVDDIEVNKQHYLIARHTQLYARNLVQELKRRASSQ